jgi:hypothetical protein
MRKDDGLLDGASGTGREIDRRTIAKGVAWTVPVVIVATAAPAVAASVSDVSLGLTAGSSKNKRNLVATVNATGAGTGSVSFDSLTRNDNPTTFTGQGAHTAVTNGQQFTLLADFNVNSDGGTYRLAYTVPGNAQAYVSISV